MKKEKTFRPLSVPFIIIMTLLNLFVVGLLALVIIGFIELNWLYIIVGVLGFAVLLFEDIKLLTWKIVFYEDYLFVPSSNFDRFIFGQKEEQSIQYKDIEKIELVLLPAQILFVQCKNSKKPNAIYVKQFSKIQVEKIMGEINTRIENISH